MGGSSWTPGALSRAAVLLSNSHGSPSLSLLSSLTPVSWTGCLGPLHSPCSRKCLARQVKKLRPLYAELICAFFSSLPLLSSLLARVQFISLWTAARHRSDHTHHPLHLSSCAALQGSYWILPINALPTLLHSISSWAEE